MTGASISLRPRKRNRFIAEHGIREYASGISRSIDEEI